jgi:DNA-binding NtrC family response regulator
MTKKKILVVDDEELIGELCCLVSKEEGHEAKYCSNITDALALLRSEVFDFILSDIKMPGGDGVEFKTRLNKMGNETPFLFMSGFASLPPESIDSLNAIGTIKKPFSVDALKQYFKKYLKN